MRKQVRWSLILLAVMGAGVGGFVAPSSEKMLAPPADQPSHQAASGTSTGGTTSAPAGLPKRSGLDKASADPFAPRFWEPPPPPRAAQAESRAAPPSVPPMPYRFAGTARYDGSLKGILVVGDAIHEVMPGALLEGVYQVRSVSSEGVTLLYTPLGIEQQLARAADAGAPPGVPGEAPSPAAPFPPGSPLASH